LHAAFNGRAPDISRLVRGLPVRVVKERRSQDPAARAELVLVDAAQFIPLQFRTPS
jgi:hypothetical protein